MNISLKRPKSGLQPYYRPVFSRHLECGGGAGVLIILIMAGILVGILPISKSGAQKTDAGLDLIKNSDLEIPQYLTIQSNSFLPITAFTSDGFSEGEKLIRVVTAYYPVPWETDDEPCIIASGMNVCKIDLEKRKICACSRKYPFGTKFLINGEVWECQDRLNIKYDDRIDLLVKNKQEMKNWGKRTIEVIKLD